MTAEPLLSIGDVAARAGMATSTLRYYDEIGLLPATTRIGDRRRYAPGVLGRLRAIRLCQRAGFTLDEIARLLDGGGDWPELAAAKSTEIRARIAELHEALALLDAAVACGCRQLETCERTVHAAGPRRPSGPSRRPRATAQRSGEPQPTVNPPASPAAVDASCRGRSGRPGTPRSQAG